jgi:hypothetical protein
MAISGLTDLLAFTEGSELITGGDFTGSNGDPVNAWWNANGGSAGNDQEIQSNAGSIIQSNSDGSSYIGRASLGKDYLGNDGARVPLVCQVDFNMTSNLTNTESAWGFFFQLWASNNDSFQPAFGYHDTLGEPLAWDDYGYGVHSIINSVSQDPNSAIINFAETSGKLRAEIVPYKSKAGLWRVEGRAFYWDGSKWVIINKNLDYANWGTSLADTGLYLLMHTSTTDANWSPLSVDNASAKEITDHGWGKDTNRIGDGFHIDYGNGKIVCEDQGGGGGPHLHYDNLYEDGVSYTTRITIDDYVDGTCKVYHGDALVGTLTADGSYVLTGACDYGDSTYDELWITTGGVATNDYSITSLTTEPTSNNVSVGGGLGFGQGWL